MASIAKCTWGAPFKYVKRLYTAVVKPRTQYAAPIWHRPEDHKHSPTTKQINGLTKVQRLAMKAITGCFRTTPTDSLQLEAQLPSVELELQKQIRRYMIHIQTLPPNHPVANCVKRAKRYCERSVSKTHLTNLEHLITKYPELMCEDMETIYAHIKPPWWNPANVTIAISRTSKEQAKRQHEESL
jgi:hypothetical protein